MSLDDWWYAVCSYDAPSEEQLSIVVGETVQLIDDSDSEWWYAMCPRTEQSGYIPALFIEVRSSAWCLRPSLIDIDEPRPSTAMATHTVHGCAHRSHQHHQEQPGSAPRSLPHPTSRRCQPPC